MAAIALIAATFHWEVIGPKSLEWEECWFTSSLPIGIAANQFRCQGTSEGLHSTHRKVAVMLG